MTTSKRIIDGTLAEMGARDVEACRRYLELGVEGGWVSEDEQAAWLPRIAAWEQFLNTDDHPVV